jgi:hypothetical protein
MVERLQNSTNPTPQFAPAALMEASLAAPAGMVLTDQDGTLTVDETDPDITWYQRPDVWPRYVCRVATLRSMIGRTTPERAASTLSTMFAASPALDTRGGPHMPHNLDPNISDPDSVAP